jgi:hypothetical protein
MSKLKRVLNKLIQEGVHIQATLTRSDDASLFRYDDKLTDWETSIAQALKGTEYEQLWRDNIGLNKPEDETKVTGYKQELVINRNFVALRLQRLREIQDKL